MLLGQLPVLHGGFDQHPTLDNQNHLRPHHVGLIHEAASCTTSSSASRTGGSQDATAAPDLAPGDSTASSTSSGTTSPEAPPLVTTGPPLTQSQVPVTAPDPISPAITTPTVDLTAAATSAAAPEAVAAAFTQQYFHIVDSDGTDDGVSAWVSELAPFSSPELQSTLKAQGLPVQLEGTTTGVVLLVSQRAEPPATTSAIPFVVQAHVVTVSPVGRLQSDTTSNYLNVMLTRTAAGWKVSAILAHAN